MNAQRDLVYVRLAEFEARAASLYLTFARRSQSDTDIYAMFNASGTDETFVVQQVDGHSWRRVVDTSLNSPDDIVEPGFELPLNTTSYVVGARSVVVLIANQQRAIADVSHS